MASLNLSWVSNLVLNGQNVDLIPMETEHRNNLLLAAQDGNLWDLWYTSVPDASGIDDYISQAISDRNKNLSYPFVIVEKSSNKIIGSTRYCNIMPNTRRLEIGYTWYSKSFQRTGVNTECKLLLLKQAFEKLDVVAVELRTHWHNHTSRNAILGLGAKQDGVLRNHRIDRDGRFADTVVFSILNTEWPSVKQSLTYKLNKYK